MYTIALFLLENLMENLSNSSQATAYGKMEHSPPKGINVIKYLACGSQYTDSKEFLCGKKCWIISNT